MPEMDGLEASSKIRSLETSVPIIALTANIMYNDREIYKKSGIHDCVGKPFTSQELWRCLMRYITPISSGSSDGAHNTNAQLHADLEFQNRMQALFVEGNKDKYEKIISALESGDITQAHRLVHILKSNAGQVGKIILQTSAADIESRLKDGKNQVTEEHLSVLRTELEMVLNEFSANI
jgi:CheY-like chemotaxis protein